MNIATLDWIVIAGYFVIITAIEPKLYDFLYTDDPGASTNTSRLKGSFAAGAGATPSAR
jgi:hypothetical protein